MRTRMRIKRAQGRGDKGGQELGKNFSKVALKSREETGHASDNDVVEGAATTYPYYLTHRKKEKSIIRSSSHPPAKGKNEA